MSYNNELRWRKKVWMNEAEKNLDMKKDKNTAQH